MTCTLKRLARFCAVYECFAEIDGDTMRATIRDNQTGAIVALATLK